MSSKAVLKKRIDKVFALIEKECAEKNYAPKKVKAIRERLSSDIDSAIYGALRESFDGAELEVIFRSEG